MAVSCTSDKPSGNASGQAPPSPGESYKLELYPAEATRRTVLRTNAFGFDAAAARIEWFVDGSLDSTPVPTEFSCAGVSRGAKVRAKAVLAGREIWSNTITVQNTPPAITYAKLLPEVFQPGDVLRIEARAEDPDGDDVALKYSWTRNGAPAGNAEQLAVQPRRGDRITASVTSFDGEAAGETLTLDRDIGNLPPIFVEHQNASLQGDRYQYQAQARDPDGDIVTFSLQSPSDGITINQTSGELIWAVPQGFTGERTVTIVADDGHSGTAQYTVTFTLQ